MALPPEHTDEHRNSIPLPLEVWEATPPEARALILMLLEQVQALRKRIEGLEEQSRANSRNSSKPPSADPPGSLRNRREPTGKPRGGQKGHKGEHRVLVPTEETTHVVKHYPGNCSKCGCGLCPLDVTGEEEPVRHQVWELPPVQVEVTEHQRYRARCPDCGHVSLADLPVGVPLGAFGPRLTAMAGLLVGQYRLSRRQCESLIRDAFGVAISLGGIKAVENLLSQSLVAPVEEVHSAIQQAPVVNADDTGWKEGNKKAVLWNANTPDLAIFRITKKKDHESARGLLGEDFDGILGVDRATTYSFQDIKKLATCWAHLDRHFQRMEDRGGESEAIGKWGKAEVDRFFTVWHKFKDGKISRPELQSEIVPIRARMARLLLRGSQCGKAGTDKTLHAKTAKTCANVLKVFPALWTCVYYEGVEPTNNSSERALRHPVQWRRNSFGTQSAAGSRFVERILSTVETCRRQGRNALEFLTKSVTALLHGSLPPSLVLKPDG